MAKVSSQFVCQTCGAAFPKWVGRCTACSAWNTLVEEEAPRRKSPGAPEGSRAAMARRVSEIGADVSIRWPTGMGEFDRVLGGGVVPGGVTLVGGDPGVGKSTLLLQALSRLAAQGHRALYVSGEESAGQTAARARRLGVDAEELLLLAENDLETIERVVREVKPKVVVLDSVQTVRVASLDSAAGTVSQLREVASRMVETAKKQDMATFLIGHVTKDGLLAGPKVMEHLVDTVLSFEGDRGHLFRVLRTQKNRFGSATEVGVFEMTPEGMGEVPNPSALFLAERPKGVPGSVIAATSEGTRPMLVEVQALVSPSSGGPGRRAATGVDGARLSMVLAVLERKAGLSLSGCDVYLNVAGGARVDEPALDLPMALALASSLLDRPVPADLVAFGEVGLAGEVRSVARVQARIAEASALGFRWALGPPVASEAKAPANFRIWAVKSLAEALEAVGAPSTCPS